MSEASRVKVQTSVQNFVDEVDRNHLRKLQKTMHECAATCCANNVSSMNEVTPADALGNISHYIWQYVVTH